MDAKEVFTKIKELHALVLEDHKRIEELAAELYSSSILGYVKTVSTGWQPDRTGDMAIKLHDAEQKLAADTFRYIEYRYQAVCFIFSMNISALETEILYKRYIEQKQWEQIEAETGYAYSHLLRVFNKANKQINVK